MGLTVIWFATGSAAALIASLLHAPLWLQIVLFVAVSGIVLYLTRGIAGRYINAKHERTNADRVVGCTAVVTEAFYNENAQGQIRVSGAVWTARGKTENAIEAGVQVQVVAIEGVKAIVVRHENAAGQE